MSPLLYDPLLYDPLLILYCFLYCTIKEMLNYGEIINKLNYFDVPKEIIEKAKAYESRGLKFEETEAFKKHGNVKFVLCVYFLTGHAQVIMIPASVYDKILPDVKIFGNRINCDYFSTKSQDYCDAVEKNDIPLKRYHLTLSRKTGDYYLSRDAKYVGDVFKKGHLYYIGESDLPETSFDILALMSCPDKYRLVRADCLEFVKSFCFPIARYQCHIVASEINRIFGAWKIHEDDSLATSESRNHEIFGETTGVGYFLSFRPDRLFLGIIVTGILFYAIFRIFPNVLITITDT